MKNKIIAVSGGMDPVHIGHLRMLEEASQYGDLVVILNSDEWLMRKKGYVFMSFEDRAEILKGFRCVSDVIMAQDKDDTVCSSLIELKPDIFANGGDRKKDNTPEIALCKELGINMMWNCGGGKIASSSELVFKSKQLL
jgi:cytidyltransferase-like protein